MHWFDELESELQIEWPHHSHGIGSVIDSLCRCTVDNMLDTTALSISKPDRTYYMDWSLEIEVHFDQKQVHCTVAGTGEVHDVKNGADFETWKNQHGITQSTNFLAKEPSRHEQYGIQMDAKALSKQLKDDYHLKVKLNVSLCKMRCQLWDWAIVRIDRSTN